MIRKTIPGSEPDDDAPWGELRVPIHHACEADQEHLTCVICSLHGVDATLTLRGKGTTSIQGVHWQCLRHADIHQ